MIDDARIDMTDLATSMTAEEILEAYCTSKYRHENANLGFVVGPATADVHAPRDAFSGVWSVQVNEAHRGQGHGRRLMRVITAWADAVGRGLFLHVYTDNEPAIRLYRSVGFRITSTSDSAYYMERYPTRIPMTPEWDRHFTAKAEKLERDHEPRLGSDHWVAFFDALYKAQMERPRLDRAEYTGSANYEENTRRLYCDATGAALLAAGWTITRTNA